MRPEVDFQTTDIDRISSLFLENGCVLLRNFCAPAALGELRVRLDALHDIVKSVHLHPEDLEQHGISQPQEYLFQDKHHALLGRVFGPSPYRDLRGNVTRRMLGGWQSPLPPHLDAFVHPMGFTVNFWLPLQPCGVTVPSLGVVCAPFGDVLSFAGFQPAPFWQDEGAGPSGNFAQFRPAMKRMCLEHDAAVAAEFRTHFGDRVWTPVFEFGDAMMLSNWTFNFTHATPEMVGPRENIEMRFYSAASLDEVISNLGSGLASPAQSPGLRDAADRTIDFVQAPVGSAAAAVAYRLFRHVADVERRTLSHRVLREGEAPANRAWVLQTYSQCLEAVRNHRSRWPSAILQHPAPKQPDGLQPHSDAPSVAVVSPKAPLNLEPRELDFSRTPVDRIVRTFFENGSLLLRNFVDPSRLLELRRVLDQLYDEIRDVHVFGDQMVERGLPDIVDYVFSEKHRRLAEGLFAGVQYDPRTLARRMQPPGLAGKAEGAWQQPLSPHIDAFFHPLFFTVNFWIPLQPCGADAPSLGVVRTPLSDVLDFVEYRDEGPASRPAPEYNFARFNRQSRQMFEGDTAAVEFFRTNYAARMWTPDYNLGDAMMLSNWTLHFTHSQAGMSQRRENVEIRLMCQATLQEILRRHAGEAAAAMAK